MIRLVVLILGLVLLAVVPISCRQSEIKIGSKKFTESIILGEVLAQLAANTGRQSKHFQELGGTRLVFNALVAGQIDAYAEYTGTINQEIFAGLKLESDEQRSAALADLGISATRPLGFNNTYAIGMLRQRAGELNIESISDLNRHPDLRLGLTGEFMDRGDGWPSLKAAYGLSHQDVRGLDHDIAYRQLASGAIDAIDVYSTDAKIKALDLKVLADDRQFFPRYDAVVLYRTDLGSRHSQVVESFLKLANQIDEPTMIALNHRVEIDRATENQVASQFLKDKFGLNLDTFEPTIWQQLLARTIEHLELVRKSLVPAILFAIPLGILAVKVPHVSQLVLGSVGIIQTVPALALLVLIMPLVNQLGAQSIGVGSTTAIFALFLYSLLPIVRNTYAGLSGIEPQYTESARALGLPEWYRMWKIELPLASRSILAGIKTAAVINVGFATLGALIGAGGYGQPILTGIRLADTNLLLQGAIPAALLAIAVQLLFELAENRLISKGLTNDVPIKP